MRTLFYYYGKWCEHCENVTPIIDQLSREGIPVIKIDVDDEFRRAQLSNIQSVPTIILVENEKEIRRIEGGGRSAQQIKAFYNFQN